METFKFQSITAHVFKIPLKKSFRISVGEITFKDGIIFEARSGDQIAWGEAAVDAIPFYTSETVGSVLDVCQTVLIPLLKSRAWKNPQEIVEAFEVYRGHRFAKAALEAVAWDIYGKLKKQSVSKMIGGTRDWVEIGTSLGIKDTPEQLVRAVEHELNAGYRRIKIKVSPGKDDEFIKAVRKAFPTISLMVDANNAYTFDDLDKMKRWDDYNLLMIEQPLNEHDLYYHTLLCQELKNPVCLDESIETVHLADCALKMKAADIINIKVCRVGGLVQTRKVHDMCQAHNVPVWIGSRLGTGVANAARLAAASLPNAIHPSDAVMDIDTYVGEDMLVNPFEIRNGCEVKVPTSPGMGVEVDPKKLSKYTITKVDL